MFYNVMICPLDTPPVEYGQHLMEWSIASYSNQRYTNTKVTNLIITKLLGTSLLGCPNTLQKLVCVWLLNLPFKACTFGDSFRSSTFVYILSLSDTSSFSFCYTSRETKLSLNFKGCLQITNITNWYLFMLYYKISRVAGSKISSSDSVSCNCAWWILEACNLLNDS